MKIKLIKDQILFSPKLRIPMFFKVQLVNLLTSTREYQMSKAKCQDKFKSQDFDGIIYREITSKCFPMKWTYNI